MKIFFRVLLAVDAICLSILSLIVMVVSPRKDIFADITTNISGEFYKSPLSAVVLFIIAFLFFCVNLTFLLSGLTNNKDKRAISKFTNIGEVKISLNTIESIALSSAKRLNGVKETKAYVNRKNDAVSIIIKAIFMQDINIPALSEDIQVRVKKTVEETSGIVVSEVRIVVENVYTGYKARVE